MLEKIEPFRITYDHLFDESGKPRFIKPPGAPLPGPLRVTARAWDEMCTCFYDEMNVFIHARFTLTSSMMDCRTVHVGHKAPDGSFVDHGPASDRQITIACPRAKPAWAIFGPYERKHLHAVKRASDYLIKAGALLIMEEER